MIKFSDNFQSVQSLIADSLGSFSTEHPDTPWFTFALYACPWSGWVSSNFDNLHNSNAVVDKCKSRGQNWFGVDEAGAFNDNCPDFQFSEWRLNELPDWLNEYENEEQIHIIDLDGREHFISHDNEEFNAVAFTFLKSVLQRELGEQLSGAQGTLRRAGVQMLDSEWTEFWQVDGSRG